MVHKCIIEVRLEILVEILILIEHFKRVYCKTHINYHALSYLLLRHTLLEILISEVLLLLVLLGLKLHWQLSLESISILLKHLIRILLLLKKQIREILLGLLHCECLVFSLQYGDKVHLGLMNLLLLRVAKRNKNSIIFDLNNKTAPLLKLHVELGQHLLIYNFGPNSAEFAFLQIELIHF